MNASTECKVVLVFHKCDVLLSHPDLISRGLMQGFTEELMFHLLFTVLQIIPNDYGGNGYLDGDIYAEILDYLWHGIESDEELPYTNVDIAQIELLQDAIIETAMDLKLRVPRDLYAFDIVEFNHRDALLVVTAIQER